MAWGLLLYGAFHAIAGLAVTYYLEGEQLIAATEHYFGEKSAVEATELGLICLAAGILTGLLVEIAKNVRSKRIAEDSLV